MKNPFSLILLLQVIFVFGSTTNATRVKNVEDARRVYVDSMKDIRRKMPRSNVASSRSKRDFGAIRAVDPTDFGADPTGKTDSTNAFQKVMDVLFNVSAYADHPMASGIHNLGGATLDLNGGEFMISEPIRVPPLVGNVRIRGGTLRASSTFPSQSFLIEIGGDGCVPKDSQGVCNEFVVVEDIFLDAAHVSRGGVCVNKTMGTTIGPSIFITGYTEYGVQVNQGHETMIFDGWLAEYYWSDKHPSPSSSCSTAIELNGEDNYVTNTILFDFSCLGVLVNGAATTLDGVHSWNGGGTAIKIDGSYDIQDRIVNCYLDYSTLDIVNAKFVLVQGNFFYNTHAVLEGSNVEGLVMRENIYSLNDYGGNVSIVLQNKTAICNNVVIEDAIYAQQNSNPVQLLRTVSRKSLHLKDATSWHLDFSDELLFNGIDGIEYALVLDSDSSLVTHAARQVSDTAVRVVLLNAINSNVTKYFICARTHRYKSKLHLRSALLCTLRFVSVCSSRSSSVSVYLALFFFMRITNYLKSERERERERYHHKQNKKTTNIS